MRDPRAPRKYGLLLVGLALATACHDGGSHGEATCQVDCEAAGVGPAGDRFGTAVAISGDVIAVGAALDDDLGNSSGSVYVSAFDGMDWIDEQKLLASDGAEGDSFGSAVAADGDVIVVGARWDDDAGADSGAAYVFRFDGMEWVEEQKIVASNAAAGDFFGDSVSVSGDVIVVGARLDDFLHVIPGMPPTMVQINDGGAAYVFRFDGSDWLEEQRVSAADPATEDYFGTSVSVSGDAFVVGSPADDGPVNRGSAYVYRFDGATWLPEQKIQASDGAANDLFATSVSMDGDTIVAGAQLDDPAGTDSGAAYVFFFGGVTWAQDQKLTASNGAAFDLFGFSVSVSGDTIAVGAYQDDAAGTDSGSAYVYAYDGMNWNEEENLVASDGEAGDFYGASVATSGDVVVAGSQNADALAPNSGAAYVSAFDGMSWAEEQKLVASDGP